MGVDIDCYHKLRTFMKGTNKGYTPKKSLVFTEEDIHTFIIHASDNTHLFLKAIAICGIFGSCRRSEMCDLRISDIQNKDTVLIINVPPSKTDKGRKFAVVDDENVSYATIFKKYLSLRPDDVPTDRVFLKYTNGRCIK